MWYDATPVLIHPDLSAHALELHLAGLLAGAATLEAYGFGTEDAMGLPERAQLLEFLQSSRKPSEPVGAAATIAGPPSTQPALTSALPDPITAEMRAWYGRR